MPTTRPNGNSGRHGGIRVFATNAGKPLAGKICTLLKLPLGSAKVDRFNDGEVAVQILENVRGEDVFIIAPTHPPAENILEAVFLTDAARLSSAGRITIVLPYAGYSRSDRKDAPRKPIGARLLFKMLEIARPDRFIILDIHAEQSLASIDYAVPDHLFASVVAVPYLKKVLRGKPSVIASPDRGGGPRAEKYAQLMGHNDFVFFSKTRAEVGKVKEDSIKIVGDVKGKVVVFVDDMIDTGGTMVADAKAAKAAGAKEIYVFTTHGLFSKDAIAKLNVSPIDRIFVTDSVYHNGRNLTKECKKITVISIAELLAEAVRRTHDGHSLSALIL